MSERTPDSCRKGNVLVNTAEQGEELRNETEALQHVEAVGTVWTVREIS